MACRWRIRHKLVLGLGLVVVILAILVAGTLHGLSSYRATVRTFDSKLVKLQEAIKLKEELKTLANLGGREMNQSALLEGTLTKAKQALDQLDQAVSDNGSSKTNYKELAQLKALQVDFINLDRAIQEVLNNPTMFVGKGGPQTLMEQPSLEDVFKRLLKTCDDFHDTIYQDLNDRIHRAKDDCKVTLIIVAATCVSGILLMLGLLRFFYGWIFYPIRDLQQGVSKVAQGNFDHCIELHSGDEIEDLAAAFNDMTGRLREMYRDLARQVNERSRQLVRSERLASVGFLAAGVSHEINNPLASIAFCSEALESRLAELLARSSPQRAEEQHDRDVVLKYLRMIQQEAFRCKEITQRLLEFSRTGERRREATDLVEVIQGVLDIAQHLQNCRGKEVVFEPHGPTVAWVNGQEIKSVVLNLVVNALDSMDDGGVLTITLRTRDGMAEMAFTDTGCGMPPEVLENIFEPFYTRSRTGKGTGLGLSISHRTISQHGGEIEASSAGPDQGSTFVVRLPLQPSEDLGTSSSSGGADRRDAEAEDAEHPAVPWRRQAA